MGNKAVQAGHSPVGTVQSQGKEIKVNSDEKQGAAGPVNTQQNLHSRAQNGTGHQQGGIHTDLQLLLSF